ncbi:NAD(P)H-dependent oxidoreductase [Helicobacter pylori]|nr:NAD(P)H-dependent oxidoreductase [Helicobacter pylori]
MKFLDHEKRRQLLNERHSCKMFDSHYEFSSTELEEIAEIARLSPSSYNTQPWHFVMVTNKDLKKQIAAHSYFNEEMIKSASALMVVCPLRPSELLPHSHYMQNLYPESYKVRVIPSFAQMLGVSLMGLDSCIIGGFDPLKVGEVLEERINKPKIACLIALGKRVAEASQKSRKSKVDAITWL